MKYITSILLTLLTFHYSSGQSKLNVLSSASMFEDMATHIGKEKINVSSIVPRGGDPHLYTPSPSDIQKVINADVIIMNGLTFEGWIKKLIDNSGTKAKVKVITEGLQPIASEEYKDSYDPHAWMSAKNGATYIKNIADVLIEADPENKEYYTANYLAYAEKLSQLHTYILDKVSTIPPKNRVLITHHDAFAYYGREYGLKLRAIKGISTEEETQASDLVRISNEIKESSVPAIFIESTINPKMIQQIAADNKVKIGGELFADSLGPKGAEADTYTSMLKHNTDVIVNALTGASISETKIDREQKGSNLLLYGGLALAMLLAMVAIVMKFK